VIGVAFGRLRLGGIDLMLPGELRTREPVRAVDHVGMAVAVDVANAGAFGEIDAGELKAIEAVQHALLGPGRRDERGAGAQQGPGNRNTKGPRTRSGHG
jgi:hypothetical protein